MMKRRVGAWAVGLAACGLLVGSVGDVAAQAPAGQSAAIAERTVWYFYKVRWGFQEEFVQLFKKNHLPVLRAQQEAGRMKSVRAFAPTNHGDGRADWTFLVVIRWAGWNELGAPSQEDAVAHELFRDYETWRKEEQRRFEILDAHWDVPLNELDLK